MSTSAWLASPWMKAWQSQIAALSPSRTLSLPSASGAQHLARLHVSSYSMPGVRLEA